MSLMSDALRLAETDVSLLPVIFPIPRDEGEATEGPETPRSPNVPEENRFAFPRVPVPREPSPIADSPRVIWPECGSTETTRACAEVAEHLCSRFSSDHPAILAFTSPGDGDGKTSLLMNLAPEVAKRATSGDVLLVDADAYHPDLTTRLTVPMGEILDDSALIYPTNLQGLSVLPMTPRSRFRGFDPAWFEDLREGWPLALLDASSLEHHEAIQLAQYCDGVYLVVRLGHTSRRTMAEAARAVRGAGGQLLGCVVVG